MILGKENVRYSRYVLLYISFGSFKNRAMSFDSTGSIINLVPVLTLIFSSSPFCLHYKLMVFELLKYPVHKFTFYNTNCMRNSLILVDQDSGLWVNEHRGEKVNILCDVFSLDFLAGWFPFPVELAERRSSSSSSSLLFISCTKSLKLNCPAAIKASLLTTKTLLSRHRNLYRYLSIGTGYR
jgi:hypothetical protein